MQAARHAIVVHDRAGCIIGWDEQASQLLGYRADEVLGKSLSLILDDGLLADDASALCTCRTKDARLLRVLWRSSPITDGADGVIGRSAVVSALDDTAPAAAALPLPQPRQRPLPLPEQAPRVVELLGLLVWMTRVDGQLTFRNGRFRAYVGGDFELDPTATWLSLVHPEDREAVEQAWHLCCAHRTDFRAECRLRRDDGNFRWFDVRGATQGAGASAEPVREWAFSAADIDEAHAVQAQLRADQARLQSIMESSPGVVISYQARPDGQLEVTFVSSAAHVIYGYSADELKLDLRPVLERLPVDDRARMFALTEESLRTGRPWHGECRYDHPSKGKRWLEPHFSLSRQPDGSLAWTGIVLDITKRKRDQERLALVQKQLEDAVEVAQMGVWVVDVEKSLIWGNHRQRALWDIPEQAPSWYDFKLAMAHVHPDDVARVSSEMERALRTGEVLEMEFRLLRPNAGTSWISMRSQSENSPDGRPRRLVGINLDITERKLLADASLRSQKLEALGTLAGGIAHDFNNILFAISGNAALALDRVAKSSAVHRFLLVIASASARATDLVRQILTFSRPHDQKLEVLDLAWPIEEALRLARATLPSMVAIEAELQPDTPKVLADSSNMVQVVLNLVTNAAHGIGKGNLGTVELRLARATVEGPLRKLGGARVPAGTYALLSVRDDGCGMSEQTLARIFDPFFTTKPPGEGTGLGLSIAHSIATALGGAITVESQLGKGSTFRLYLPATEQPERAAPVPGARKFGRGQEILLVDDEPMIMEVGREMLVTLGYRPTTFEDARDALATFRQDPQRFSVVVTDLSMPAMSGFEFARELLSIRADTQILLMSGYVGPEERATATRIGVRSLVLKPLSMEQLSELLAELCRES